jgi:hypothetical protein
LTDSSSNGLVQFDSAAVERFLCEWGLKIQEPSPDEEAEVIANRIRIKEKRLTDPTHQQVP